MTCYTENAICQSIGAPACAPKKRVNPAAGLSVCLSATTPSSICADLCARFRCRSHGTPAQRTVSAAARGRPFGRLALPVCVRKTHNCLANREKNWPTTSWFLCNSSASTLKWLPTGCRPAHWPVVVTDTSDLHDGHAQMKRRHKADRCHR